MKKIGSGSYETLKEAGYKYIESLGNGEHLLLSPEDYSEVWCNSKDFAGYALIFKNTHLEYCRQYNHAFDKK